MIFIIKTNLTVSEIKLTHTSLEKLLFLSGIPKSLIIDLLLHLRLWGSHLNMDGPNMI